MKTFAFACFVLTGGMFFTNPTHADELPSTLNTTLQQREQTLNEFRFTWSVTLHDITLPVPTSVQSKLRSQVEPTVAQMDQHPGDNQTSTLTQQTHRRLQGLEKLWQGYTIDASSLLTVERNGAKTLALGVNNDSPNLAFTFQQLYQGNLGIVVNSQTRTTSGQHVIPVFPSVWASQGDSVRYPLPVLPSLNLPPEQFVLLAGFNPLAMYGTQWTTKCVSQIRLYLEISIRRTFLEAVSQNKAFLNITYFGTATYL